MPEGRVTAGSPTRQPRWGANARSKLDECDAKSMDDAEHSARLEHVMAWARVEQSTRHETADVIVQ